MTRKLRTLSAVLTAVAAALSLSASAASAASIHSTSEHTILTLTPTSEYVFTAGEGFGSVSCQAATLEGTMTGTEATGSTWEAGVTEDTACKDAFGRNVHVKCTKDYHTETTWLGFSHDWKCAGKTSITITSGAGVVVCTVEIPNQTGLKSVSASNTSSDVDIEFNLTGIKNTTSGGFLNCGITNGEHSNGSLTGTATLSGVNTAGEAVKLQVE